MAKYIGKGGIVLAGGTAIGNLNGYSVVESVSPIEQKSLADEWMTFSTTATDHPKQWTGSATAHFDDGDAVQESMTSGAELAFLFHPRGTGSTLPERSGNGIISNIEISAEVDGMLEVSFDITGNGALARADQV